MRDVKSDHLGVTTPRLLDILMTVAYGLTFHGTEADKRELLKSLLTDTAEEVESRKTLSTTEVKKRLGRQKKC